MPLKHHTETLLVFLLGVAIALSGVLAATLPSLPLGLVPWSFVFALSLAYPLTLIRLFKKRRADKEFRLLHWFPALVLLVWGAMEWTVLHFEDMFPALEWYTWAWTLPAVTIGFVLVASFCLHVIRRRTPRLVLLAVAFIPFTVLGVMSEQGYHWETELAAVMWQGDWWKVDYSGSLLPDRTSTIAQQDSVSSKNLEPSEDPSEERYRARLREIEKRRQQLVATRKPVEEEKEEEPADPTPEDSLEPEPVPVPTAPSTTGTGRDLPEIAARPNRLPGSGGGVALLSFLTLAGYLGTLHNRARKRLV